MATLDISTGTSPSSTAPELKSTDLTMTTVTTLTTIETKTTATAIDSECKLTVELKAGAYKDPAVKKRVCDSLLEQTPFPDVLNSMVYEYLVPTELTLWTTTPSTGRLTAINSFGVYTPLHKAEKNSDGKLVVRILADFASICPAMKAKVESKDYECQLQCAPEIMELLCDFIVHHEGIDIPCIEKPLRSKIMRDVCLDVWDADFIDAVAECRQRLYDLIHDSNALEMKGLVHLGCAKTAALIKGQPLEKIAGILGGGAAAGAAIAPAPVVAPLVAAALPAAAAPVLPVAPAPAAADAAAPAAVLPDVDDDPDLAWIDQL